MQKTFYKPSKLPTKQLFKTLLTFCTHKDKSMRKSPFYASNKGGEAFLKSLFAICVIFATASLYALDIPKQSGEWVYFKDEVPGVFIGVLSYDDSTIQARLAGKEKLALYLKIDTSKGYLDFSGERIESEKKAEDAQLINHLHEVLWSLDKIAEGFVVARGKTLSATDRTFEQFPGFEKLTPKKHSFRRNKKAQPLEITLDDTCLVLDGDWVAIAENCWALGNVANITTAKAQGPANDELVARLTESSDGTYKNLSTAKITKTQGYKLSIEVYDSKTNALMINFMRLTPSVKGEGFFFFSMAVMKDVYEKNRKYFDAIESSFSILELP